MCTTGKPYEIFKREIETLSTGLEIPVIKVDGVKYAAPEVSDYVTITDSEIMEAVFEKQIIPPFSTEAKLIDEFPLMSLQSPN